MKIYQDNAGHMTKMAAMLIHLFKVISEHFSISFF